jgi:hypothetical protein
MDLTAAIARSWLLSRVLCYSCKDSLLWKKIRESFTDLKELHEFFEAFCSLQQSLMALREFPKLFK